MKLTDSFDVRKKDEDTDVFLFKPRDVSGPWAMVDPEMVFDDIDGGKRLQGYDLKVTLLKPGTEEPTKTIDDKFMFDVASLNELGRDEILANGAFEALQEHRALPPEWHSSSVAE